jgi:hypothetical protein
MAAASSQDLYSRVFGDGVPDPSQTAADTVKVNDTPELDELAHKVERDVGQSEGPFQAWEGPAKEDSRYYDGHQWDDIDRMRMEQLKRPALVFNDIRPIVNAISGLERLNRQDVGVKSRPMDSNEMVDEMGELATEALSTADDLCDAAEEDSEIAKRCVITGMGWGEVSTSYEEDVNGRIVWRKIPEWEMRWDPNARAANLVDAEWVARKREISRKKFAKQWPGMLEKIDANVPDMPYGETEKYELVTPYYSIGNEKANPQIGAGVNAKKTVSVIQYQWRDMQPIYRFEDEDSGEITTLDEDQWERLEKRMKLLGGTPPPAVRQLKPVYREVKVARGVVLEEPVDLPGGKSLICMTGEWDGDKKRWKGVVRDMIDPQKTKNKAISSALGFHITNAKGGVIFKTKMFADPTMAKDQWSRYDAWVEADDNANLETDFIQRDSKPLPSELPMFFTEATKAITRSSGVSEEMVGTAMGQTPSQTQGNRQQAGLVVLGWFFDNLNRHRRERAHITLEFIREYWTQGQYLQVGGEVNSPAIPLFKESMPAPGNYSFVLDDSVRHNPNLKAQVWKDLTESGVIQAMMKMGMGKVILALLKFSPFPSSVVNLITKTAADIPPPPQKGQKGAQKQDDPGLIQSKTKLFDAQTQKALAQARQIDQSTGVKMAEMVSENMMKGDELRQRADEHRHRQVMDHRKAALGVGQAMLGGKPMLGGQQ